MVPRAADGRYVCVCRSFTLLFVAMLRHQGVPARARCGFGAYFEKGKFYDHWVAEYWNTAEKRWVMVDSQVDDRQRRMFGVTLDTLTSGVTPTGTAENVFSVRWIYLHMIEEYARHNGHADLLRERIDGAKGD